MSELLDLADRVEKLAGPCRETDGKIKLAFAAQLFAGGATKDDAVLILGGDLYTEPLPYTGSLDVAMTLVPKGWAWRLDCWTSFTARVFQPEQKYHNAHSRASAPIALTAASLRAHAASTVVLQERGAPHG